MIDLRKPAKLAFQDLEHKLQKASAQWLKKELYNRGLPQLAFHPANERKASIKELANLKLQGVLSGASDWIILIPAGEYHGLVIELKKAGGTTNDDQKKFLIAAAAEGFFAVVINDMETFKVTVTEYLNLRK